MRMIDPFTCPTCDYKMNAAAVPGDVESEPELTEGLLMVCAHCGALTVWHGKPTPPTVPEWTAALLNPEVARIRLFIQRSRRRRNHGGRS